MEGGPPCFIRGFTSPILLWYTWTHLTENYRAITFFGPAFTAGSFPIRLIVLVPSTPGRSPVWAVPFSLAATNGIAVALFSSGYLDVSVPQVRFCTLCVQVQIPFRVGFPIQISQDHSLVANSLGLFAGSHVFHRLSTPRHPPYALSNLIAPTSDRPPLTHRLKPLSARSIRPGRCNCLQSFLCHKAPAPITNFHSQPSPRL